MKNKEKCYNWKLAAYLIFLAVGFLRSHYEGFIMSVHIEAKRGEIADIVLLPGAPLRARFIAETYLENPVCYNHVRNMFGYTGAYKGKRVSVQGTGMGVPSISNYTNELIAEYGVTTLIRVGSCGSIQPFITLRDIVVAMTASSDTQINKLRFSGRDYCPTASFDLLLAAYQAGKTMGIDAKVGNVFTTDQFYHDDKDYWKLWADFGVLAIEMETAALYTLAAKYKVRALTILTVSDDILTGAKSSSMERQKTFTDMAEMALKAAAS